MTKWIAQHARALAGALGRLVRSPLANLFNIVVIAVALALPAGLYVGLLNLQSAVRAVAPEPQLTLFLALDAGRTDARDIETRLEAHRQVARFRFIPREQALEQMKRSSGMSGIAEGLERNPLPDAFVVDAGDASPAALQNLRGELEKWPKVAHVQLDAAWAQRLDGVLKFGRIAVLMLATILAFALVAITFNTIRLHILTQREEIEVAKLIGATDAFIRRPFLYYGGLLGFAGGLAACGVVAGAIHVVNGALIDLSQLYDAQWSVGNLALEDSASFVVFAIALGCLGAWLSVARHLSEARPR